MRGQETVVLVAAPDDVLAQQGAGGKCGQGRHLRADDVPVADHDAGGQAREHVGTVVAVQGVGLPLLPDLPPDAGNVVGQILPSGSETFHERAEPGASCSDVRAASRTVRSPRAVRLVHRLSAMPRTFA